MKTKFFQEIELLPKHLTLGIHHFPLRKDIPYYGYPYTSYVERRLFSKKTW